MPRDAVMSSMLSNTLVSKCVAIRCASMSLKPKDTPLTELKQLWGESIPSLTPEQIELSIQLWNKIKVRREREQW